MRPVGAIALAAMSALALGAGIWALAPVVRPSSQAPLPPVATPEPPTQRHEVPSVPDIVVAQAAYDRAKALAQGRHVEGLKIDDLQCSTISTGRFLCQIRYVRDDETNGRVHFAVVTLERGAPDWTLTNGLCRGDGSIDR
jgi:hypothetical protein